MKKLILILAILPYIFTACVEEDNLPQYLGEFKLGAEGEAYIKFEPGSYWIYENDKTGVRDTVLMQSYKSEILYYEGSSYTFHKEHIWFNWLSKLQGKMEFEQPSNFPDATRKEDFNVNTDLHTYNCFRPGIGHSNLFFYPFITTYSGATSGQNTLINAIHDTLTISDSTFYNVAEFDIDYDWIWDSKPTKYYWAKNIGLIKRERYEHWTGNYAEGWNLVEYYVLP